MCNIEDLHATALSLVSLLLPAHSHLRDVTAEGHWCGFAFLPVCVEVDSTVEVCEREGWPKHPGTAFERERVHERKLWVIYQWLLNSSHAPNNISPLLCEGHIAPGRSGQAKGMEGPN